MVEFAIVLPVLLLFIFGIINFGWIFHGYITLTGAAREGARLAIVGVEEAEVHSVIKDHAKIFGENLEISPITPVAVREERLIEVSGDLNLLISFPPFPNSIALNASATMRQEQ